MKALVKREAAPGLWMEEVDEPVCGPSEVKVKILKTSICGTDIHIYKWDEWASQTIPAPMRIGHEWMGEVIEVGANVKEFKPGQRVSGEGHIVCGVCRNCRAGLRHLCIHQKGIGVHMPGSFAEYFTIPATNVFPIPDSIPDDIAAIFDPLGNAVHTALSYDLIGEDVLITGAGPIGMMAALIADHAGARHVVITDLHPYRLKLAKSLGIETVVDVSKTSLEDIMPSINMVEGFDVGLEMSGSPHAFRSMIETVKNGAKLALLGILPDDTQIPWSQVIFKDLFIKGIYGREIFETWYKMASMLESGLDVEKIITHRFHYTDFMEGFEIMAAGDSGKIILDWSS